MKNLPFNFPILKSIFTLLVIWNSSNIQAQFQTAIGLSFPTNETGVSGLMTNSGDFLILANHTNHPLGIGNSLGDIMHVRLNPLGYIIQPSKMLGQDLMESAIWMEKTVCGTGGYIVMGSQFNGSKSNVIVALTDINCNPVWTKRIATAQSNNNANGGMVKEDGNGDFIVVTTKDLGNAYVIEAVKLDCAGNQIWSGIYPFNRSAIATSITEFATLSTACTSLPNQYFITGVAIANSGDDEMFILSIDVSSGNFNWMNTYDIAPSQSEYATCIQGSCLYNTQLNGELWVSGYSLDPATNKIQMFMMKTSATGNLLWSNTYEIAGDVELPTHFQFATTGELMITGRAEGLTSPPRPATRTGQCFLMKLSNDGNHIFWTRVYEQGFASQANRVEPLFNGNFFLTGYSYKSDPPAAFDFDILAIKTDSSGQTSASCQHNQITDIIKRSVTPRGVSILAEAPDDFSNSILLTKTYQDTQRFCVVSPRPKCDSLFTFLNQDTNQLVCCFNMNIDNATPNCFTQIQIDLSSGNFINVVSNQNWMMNNNTNQILVGHASGFIPAGSLNPGSFCVTGEVDPFTITISYLYSNGGVAGKCEEKFILNCPALPFQACACPKGNLPGPNLVQNGSFTFGNVGFTSGYPYTAPPTAIGFARYSIRNSTNLVNSAWACTDHTTGAPLGQFMAVDGSTLSGFAVWQNNIQVVQGKQYSFCAFVNNLVNTLNNFSDPTLELWINSTLQATTTPLTESPDVWVNLSTNWTSNVTGVVPIEIRLAAPSYASGYDFAIDDIAFHECLKDTIVFNPDTCCTKCAGTSSWQSVSNQYFIQDMVVYDNKLIIGGVFNVGGFDNIAAWDGTNWFQLGTGLNGTVEALVVHNGKLYAAGAFSNQGNNIAEWNGPIPGGSWNTSFPGMSGGIYTRVASLLSTSQGLVAGGSFQNPANNIALWNGTNWSNLGGSGIIAPPIKGGGVNALGLFNGKIVAGGVFSPPLKNIAILNSNFWTNLGNGINLIGGNFGEGVKSILQFGPTKLAVGGRFMEAVNANTVAGTNFIAQWNGTNWSSMNTGVNTSFEGIYDLKIHCGDLYACGLFTQIGGNNITGVAHWDDNLNIWTTASNHTNQLVRALENFKTDSNSTCDLFSAGENLLNHLKCITANEDLMNTKFSVYPNPTNSKLIIELNQNATSNYTLSAIDLCGKKVLNEILVKGEKHAVLDMSKIAVGFYLIELRDKNFKRWYRKVVKE